MSDNICCSSFGSLFYGLIGSLLNGRFEELDRVIASPFPVRQPPSTYVAIISITFRDEWPEVIPTITYADTDNGRRRFHW